MLFDLDCNPCNQKHVSNVHTFGKDEFIQVLVFEALSYKCMRP
jgi:hypothetical protein